MEIPTINPDLYRDLSQLEDDIMDFIKENGPKSLSNPIINEFVINELIPKWADDLEVNSDEDMLYIRLILDDTYDSDINLNLSFYARIRELYTSLLKSDIQDLRDSLEKSLGLGLIVLKIQKEGKTILEQRINETVGKVLKDKWIKFDSYDTELEVNPDTGGYLVVNIYEGSTYISFHFDL